MDALFMRAVHHNSRPLSHWEGVLCQHGLSSVLPAVKSSLGNLAPSSSECGSHRPWAHLRADKKLKQSCHNTQKVTKRKHTVPGYSVKPP